MRRRWLTGVLLIAGFLLLVLYSSGPLFLPRPQPTSIPPDQFSAERALRHVEMLAQSPRRTGTTGMQQAAAYIASALRACGLEPETRQSRSSKGTLRNTVARISGARAGKAILIVSHVDSVSYGAGDNASGAAVLLETACALRAGRALQNEVILLFEDGEEDGYLGGYAFAASGGSIGAIHAVLGLDTAAWGPVVLLQTTPGNSHFIRAYAASVKDPIAFGFFADADWNISKDTSEIQPFYEQGIPGLELEDPTAFAGKHSETDTVNKVQPGSIQQMGDQVLSLVRFLGDNDLNQAADSDLSYFTLWGIGLVHYPARWNLVLTLVSAIGVAMLVIRGIKQQRFNVRRLLSATTFAFIGSIGAASLGVLGAVLFGKLFPNPNPNIGSYLVPASLPFCLAVIVLVMIAYLLLRQKLAERFGHPAADLVGLFPWLVVAVAASALLPVGSSIFALPLLTAVLAALLPLKMKFAKIVPAATATLLFAPNIILAFIAAGMQTLALIVLLLAMNTELWAEVYSRGSE